MLLFLGSIEGAVVVLGATVEALGCSFDGECGVLGHAGVFSIVACFASRF